MPKAKKKTAKKSAAKRFPASKKAPASKKRAPAAKKKARASKRKAPAAKKKAPASKKKAPASKRKAHAKKVPAKKVPAKKVPAKKAPAAKRFKESALAPVVVVAPTPPTEAEIRERAALVWQQRGRPTGEDVAIWFEAERQLLAERS